MPPSRTKLFLLLLNEKKSLKSKTLVNLESFCCKIEIFIFFTDLSGEPNVLPNSWNSREEMRTNFNSTFSKTADGVERILKAVFELMFSKRTYVNP